ncbi:MAG: Prolyl-tRNA synthetase, bacterial type, partial [uncultured Thermoleophilia bacterium]
ARLGPPAPDPARRAGRRRGDEPPTARARRLRAPGRRRPLELPAARLQGPAADDGHHPRGDGRDRRAGDADARDAPGRALAADRALRHHGAVQAEGPRRPRPRPGHDARGGHRVPRRGGGPLVPRPAADLVPHPDEGAGRAAASGGRAPDARVHHEGRVHPRPGPRRPRRGLREARGRVRPHLHPRGPRVLEGRVGHRHDGRLRRARVHGAVPGRRGSGRPLPERRLRRQRRAGGLRSGPARVPAVAGARGGRDAGGRHHRGARGLPRHRRADDDEGRHRRPGGRAGRARPGPRPWRPPRPRAQADEGARDLVPAGHPGGDPGHLRCRPRLDRRGRRRRRRAARGARRRRAHRRGVRRRSEPDRASPRGRRARPRLHRAGGRHPPRRGRRALRRLRRRAPDRDGDRGRQHLQARHALRGGARRDLPGRERARAADLDGLLRHRAGADPGLHRRATPRPARPAVAARGGAVRRLDHRHRRRRGARRGRPHRGGAGAGRPQGARRRPRPLTGRTLRRRGPDRRADPRHGRQASGQGRHGRREAARRRRGAERARGRRGAAHPRRGRRRARV